MLLVVLTKGSLKLKAKVQLRAGYPITPPMWSLTVESVPKSADEVILPREYLMLMDNADQVESLRQHKDFLSTGEPIRPILDQIESELLVYYSDYCKPEMLDFLITF